MATQLQWNPEFPIATRDEPKHPDATPEDSEEEPAAAAKSLQSCPTLCNPTEVSPPGSPIPGIL